MQPEQLRRQKPANLRESRLGRMLTSPLDARMTLALTLALLLICFNMFLSYRSVERLIANNRTLTHSYEALTAAASSLTALQDVENAQREFLITGDADYLPPYYQAIGREKEHLQELKTLAQGSQLAKLLPPLTHLIDQRLKIAQHGVELRQSGRFEDAQGHVRSRQGRQVSEQIRRGFSQIMAYENSRLDAANRDVQNSVLQALLTLIVASLANLALLLLVYRMLARDIARRELAAAVLRESEAELRRSEARKSAILATALDCIISIDSENRVIEWNPAAEATFGYLRAEALGKWLPELVVPPDQRQQQLEGISQYMTMLQDRVLGERIEVISMRKDGTEFPAELAVTRIESEDGPMFTAYLRDITQRKQIELALHEARDAAEAANRTKSEFLANMSHELRTPLNVILGYAELLEEEAEDEDRSELVSDLYKIRHAGHHLLTLINHVLDLSKIEAGKMDVYAEDFDVRSLVSEVTETVRLLMGQNANTLYLHCQPELGRMFSDPVKIRQGLLNLLSNAAKFTHGGTVTLEALREIDAHGDWLLFCITDTGIGIAPEKMGTIFEPFVQADASTTREFGGTGLGLALTRHFCYLLGGEVTVSSVPGEGSSFTMRLPVTWNQTAAPQAAGEEQPLEVPAYAIPSEYPEFEDDTEQAALEAEASASEANDAFASENPLSMAFVSPTAELVELGELSDLALLPEALEPMAHRL